MRLRLLFTVLIILAGGFYVYQRGPQDNIDNFFSTELQEIQVEDEQAKNQAPTGKENLTNQELPSLPKPTETKLIEQKKEVSAPPPLKIASPPAAPPSADGSEAPAPSPVGLTTSGIISETNIQRQQNGLSSLATNGTLNSMALHKANDMCDKQYFAHTSPTGVGAGDLADSFGYNYIAVGENLAYGPFSSDFSVVEAWMNSPGHRANILNSKFTEMGAAAARCILQGKNTWLAVQHFGKPASLCPKPTTGLLQDINQKKDTLAYLKQRITNLKGEIETTDWADPTYVSKVDTYNTAVKEYNALIAETKNLIGQYNSQVGAYNSCVSS